MGHAVFNFDHLSAMDTLDFIFRAFLLFQVLLNFVPHAFEATIHRARNYQTLAFFSDVLYVPVIIASWRVFVKFKATNLTEFELKLNYVLRRDYFRRKFHLALFVRAYKFFVEALEIAWLLSKFVIYGV